MDATVITWAAGQGVTLGYQHFVTQRVNTPALPGGDKASKLGDSAYSRDDVYAVMVYSGIDDPQDVSVRSYGRSLQRRIRTPRHAGAI